MRDYLINEKWVPHGLSRDDLRAALAAARQAGVENGWKYIAKFGDPYAGLASLVTKKDGASFGKMVHRHWRTVVGEERESEYFAKVAVRHFHQYVQILATGTWPDSNQILLSYLTAVRAYGLPDELVFDAAWLSSRYHVVLDWRAFNILPLGRWAHTERVCVAIDAARANEVIEKDFGLRE